MELKSLPSNRDHRFRTLKAIPDHEPMAADGIGLNAQTQTGYDADGHTDFHFGHKGYLCGTNGDDATAALVARGKKP
jgi:hypothetical protein